MPPPATPHFVPESVALEPSALTRGAPSRIRELDATRAMLMMLGVVVHAANPYAAQAAWIVTDGTNQVWLHHLQRIPHAFRMPGFFLLAGFLGTLALQKRGPAEFLRRRTIRLLWPLITSLLTINALQYWYVHWYINVHCRGQSEFCAAHATAGLWVSHLWFLFFLLGYSLLLPLIARLMHWAPIGRRLHGTPLARMPLFVAVTAPLLGSLLLKAAAGYFPWLYQRLIGVGSLFDFATFGLYFGLGVLIASWPLLRQRIVSLPGTTALLLTSVGVAAYFAADLAAARQGVNGRTALIFWMLCQAFLTIGCIRLFMLLSSRLPGLATRIADSSYTVYLFHHFFVILTALALVAWPGPAGLKFLIVMTVAGSCSYQLHRQVISRSRLLRLLFNGAW